MLLMVMFFLVILMTTKGASYGWWRGFLTASILMKTWVQLSRSLLIKVLEREAWGCTCWKFCMESLRLLVKSWILQGPEWQGIHLVAWVWLLRWAQQRTGLDLSSVRFIYPVFTLLGWSCQRRFELLVEALDKVVGLWVIAGSRVALNVEQNHDFIPQARLELAFHSPMWGWEIWYGSKRAEIIWKEMEELCKSKLYVMKKFEMQE